MIDEISEHEKGLNFLQTANANYETDLQQKKVKRDEIEKQMYLKLINLTLLIIFVF